MTFKRCLTDQQWATLCEIADDEEFAGSSDANAMSLLFALIHTCQLRRVLQVGTWIGFSTVVLSSALPEDGLLMTCDIATSQTAKAAAYVERASLTPRVRFIVGASLDDATIAEAVAMAPWDLVYVDGSHEYDTVRGELNFYWTLLRRGGYLAAHDASLAGPAAETDRGGSAGAVRDWRAERPQRQGILFEPPAWPNPCGLFLVQHP